MSANLEEDELRMLVNGLARRARYDDARGDRRVAIRSARLAAEIWEQLGMRGPAVSPFRGARTR